MSSWLAGCMELGQLSLGKLNCGLGNLVLDDLNTYLDCKQCNKSFQYLIILLIVARMRVCGL